MTEIDEENYLKHYGILRKSGRYPWGSGANPHQRSKSFLQHVAELRKEGLSDTEIARGFGMTTTELRAANSIAKNQQKQADIAMATKLKYERGMSNMAIGEKMGKNESSIRSLLAEGAKERADILQTTASMLKRQLEEKGGYLDIGKGVENHIGVSKERLATAVAMLKAEGYVVHKVQVDQLGTSNKTTLKVLAPPGTTYKDIVTNKAGIKSITEVSEDGGRSFFGMKDPLNVSSKRIEVAYAEDGGAQADGVIYVRPGVPDLSLGNSRYAQVRIAVDGTHYLKGMAMYKDDLPPGVDLVFNTNKAKADIGTDKLAAMKKLKDDPDNPFGAVVRQLGKYDDEGNIVEVTSAMNIVNEEGSWDRWKKSISTQVLSKQSPVLAQRQLDQTYEIEKQKLEDIMSLTNPAVRAKLLREYSDAADASAVHLKAAALPRQRAQVILPINSLKETEVYAPNYRDGERVALIRYPHGGTFEIPELIVNNKHPEAKSLLGQAADAIGINHKVAERLSGADFDGDSVLVIPNPINNPHLKTQPALEGLKNFDPQTRYKAYDGMKTIDGGVYNAKTGTVDYGGKSPNSRGKGTQMGLVSNLITDMTIKGANPAELAAAVRHSMVVIDAEKHVLDYKRSSEENGIPHLMEKYQGRSGGGSSTLISRATSRTDIPRQVPRPAADGGPIDKATGKKVFVPTGESYVNSKGKVVIKTQRAEKLAVTDDAFTLVSGPPGSKGTKIEQVYAEHSNRMKALANLARREMVNTPNVVVNPSAKKTYSKQVESLDAKLDVALRNAPRERQAQVLANRIVAMKKQASPDMDDVQYKRVKSQALNEARVRAGAKKTPIYIDDDEWTAIQAGAVSNSKLKAILDNANIDRVRELSTPKTRVLMTPARSSRAKSLLASGLTQAEVADVLGVSLSTLKRELNNA